MEIRKPNLFIVGAPKCGTTSMWYYLNQHPDIYMIPEKEPQYFNTDLHFSKRYTESEYLELFNRANSSCQYLGEASPLYLMSEVAAKNIKAFNPDSKIIIMVRNPADLIYSYFLQNRVNLIETEKSFEKALSLEEARRKETRKSVNGQPIQRLFYSQLAQYKVQISRYLEFFKRDQIHIILFDNLKKDTEKEVRKVFDFLKIDPSTEIKSEVRNQAKRNRSAWVQRFIDDPPKWLRKPLRLIFSHKSRSKIYWFLWWSNKKKMDASLKPNLKREINLMYKSQIVYVSEKLNLNLDYWYN